MHVYTFDLALGHRIAGDPRCSAPHGHSYRLELGIGVDPEAATRAFRRLSAYLDSTFAGGFVLQEGDPLVAFLHEENSRCVVLGVPPTVSNLAEALREALNPLAAMQLQHLKLTEIGGMSVVL